MMSPSMRRRARRSVMQALYQWQLSDNEPQSIVDQFLGLLNPKKVDIDYFQLGFQGTLASLGNIDEQMAPYLDRDIQQVDPVERAILRLATWELCDRIDVPYKVVINEALELAKSFGAEDGHKYVNGVLDKLARKIRTSEI